MRLIAEVVMKSTILFRQLFDQESFTYSYLLADPNSKEGLLIDPVKEQIERDLTLIAELGIKLKYVLDTHIHADHITGSGLIRERIKGVQTVLSEGSHVHCANLILSNGDELSCGSLKLKALATPGHTSGCMSYYIDGMVFTGDTLLIRGCGRTDFQQGSPEQLYNSVRQKLFTLPDCTLV
ncbi:MAG: sulfur dioxygenase, partial [Glaciecola sp.]